MLLCTIRCLSPSSPPSFCQGLIYTQHNRYRLDEDRGNTSGYNKARTRKREEKREEREKVGIGEGERWRKR
jgi:hypothetical protein